MKKLAWILALGLALTTTGRLMADTAENEEAEATLTTQNAYNHVPGQKVLCEAWPVYTSGYYYWISFNYAYSYNQALGACSYNHGACRVWCRVVW